MPLLGKGTMLVQVVAVPTWTGMLVGCLPPAPRSPL